MKDNNSNSSCVIGDPTREHLLLVSVGVAGVSFVICGLSLLPFLYFVYTGKMRGQSRISVRLFLYLVASAMIKSVGIAFQTTAINYRESDPREKYLCIVAGFMNQYCSWVVILFAMVATAHVMIMAILKCTDKNFSKKIEYFYILLPIILPLTFSWIPFIHDSFGLSGAWCWIEKYNDNCTLYLEGYVEQYVLWYSPMWLILLLNVLFIVVFAIVQCKTHMSTQDRNYLLQQTVPLLVMSVLIQLSTFVGLAVHAAISPHMYTNTTLWLVHAVSSSVWGFIVGVSFLFYQCVITRSKNDNTNSRYEPLP